MGTESFKFSENAKRVMEKRYLAKDKTGKIVETPEEMFRRVAKNITKADKFYNSTKNPKETEEKFYKVLSSLEFLPNSPTLMNAGRDLQQLSACFVLPIEDSMESIFGTIKDTAMIHKCLVKETLVSTRDGIKRLKELKIRDKILTDEGYFNVEGVHENGEQIVYEVLTNRGYTLKGTAEHRLLVVENNGEFTWRQIGGLKEGDWIVMKPSEKLYGGNNKLPNFKYNAKPRLNSGCFKEQKIKLPKKLTPELAKLIGIYIGDGSRHRDGIRFSVGGKDTEMVQIIKNLSETIFEKKASVCHTLNKGYEVSILSVIVKKWFESLGVTKPSAREVNIPKIIFKATEDVICAFLGGLFSTDGCVRENGHMILTTSSKMLSEELQSLMFYIGIPTHRRYYPSTRSFQISICTKEGFIKFKQKINFLLTRQKKRLAAIGPEDIFKRGETVPNQRVLIKDWYEQLDSTEERSQARRFLDDIINRPSDLREISRQKITTIQNKICPQFLKTLLNKNYFFVKASCVNPVGIMDTYDITVSHKHAYLANGFITHNSGGGTGFSFSRLRPKNSPVKTTGGISSGPVSFMKVFNAATQAVKQGGTRRGANMGILRVDHPDILEFITCKESDKDITNFNISIGLTEDFMERAIKGEDYDLLEPHTKTFAGKLNAKEVLDLMIKMAWKNGEPGIVFLDRLNKDNPTPEVGEIESTNPCVTGDTLVSTEKGLMEIKDIAKQYTEGGVGIFTDDRVQDILYGDNENGGAIATKTRLGVSKNIISKAFKSGTKPVFKIITESGYELKATADHKIMTTSGWRKVEDLKLNEDEVLIQPAEGKFSEDEQLPISVCNYHKGDNGVLYKFNFPHKWSKELGQVLGWLVGDGWLIEEGKNCRVGLTFSEDDKEILSYLKPIINDFCGSDVKEVKRENGVYHLSYHSKYFVEFIKNLGIESWHADEKCVPSSIFTASREAVIGFLQGLFSADGTVGYLEDKTSYIRLTSKSEKLLKQVQVLLINLGVKSKIYDRSREPSRGFEYINKKGETKDYALDGVCFELSISRNAVSIFLEKIGFLCNKKSVKIEKLLSKNYYNVSFVEKINTIDSCGEEEVYDLTEPATHSFIANGVVISNCGEQPLLPYESCNLGSINLSLMIKENEKAIDYEKLAETVKTAVHFLDNVIDMNHYPLKRIKEMTRSNRKIGLGIMGFADMLVLLGIRYNSEEAIKIAEEVMKFVLDKAVDASKELAKERGVFSNFEQSTYAKQKKMRIRNATLTTIAPTGSISIISNCSSGIEPLFALSYVRKILDNEKLLEVHPHFERIAREKGFYSSEIMQKVAESGSIEDIQEIPKEVRDIFVTSFDIKPIWHIRMQAAFQKYTHNAVSKTVNFPNESTEGDIREVYMLAYKTKCKGVTVYRDGSRSEQVLNIDNKKSTTDAQLVSTIVPRPRPNVTRGTTTKIATGCGNLYITINEDEKGLPFEIFMQMGKAGGCAMSQLEAIGRLLSLGLRSGIEISSIIEQLRGIRCPSPSWEKGGRIFSCSDAIARVVERRLVKAKKEITETSDDKSESGSPDLDSESAAPNGESGAGSVKTKKSTSNIVGVCPDCGGALWHVEGCMVCRGCGYSKCG